MYFLGTWIDLVHRTRHRESSRQRLASFVGIVILLAWLPSSAALRGTA